MANILSRRLVAHAIFKRAQPVIIGKRTDTDFCADKIGEREIVGFGWNGCPSYCDRLDYPFPSIRFKEPSTEICALREKETSDWKKLTLEEKRSLYRYSFCQTFAEMKAPTGEWKFSLGLAFWIISLSFILVWSYTFLGMYPEKPVSYEESHRRAQLRRMLTLEVQPVTGVTSKWDKENDRWK